MAWCTHAGHNHDNKIGGIWCGYSGEKKDENSRIVIAGKAAQKLVDDLQKDGVNASVSVVSFDGYYEDHLFYQKFVGTAEVEQSLTKLNSGSLETIKDNIPHKFSDAGGGTGMNTGLEVGSGQFSRNATNKVIVLLADGDYNGTDPLSKDGCVSSLKTAGIKVHTIGFTTSNETLQGIASKTGGKYYQANDADSLAGAFKQIATSLKAMITDPLGDNVEVVGEPEASDGGTATVTNGTLKWNPKDGKLDAGETNTITYTVKLKDSAINVGTANIALNGQAVLSYEVGESSTTKTLEFPIPEDKLEVGQLTTIVKLDDKVYTSTTGSKVIVYENSQFAWTLPAEGDIITYGGVTYTYSGSTYDTVATTDTGAAVTAGAHTLVHNYISAPKYTVTYNANGATSGTAPEDTKKYEKNDTVTVLTKGDLAKTNYVFDGWNTEADGSGDSYEANNTFKITEDVTLYAQWELDIWNDATNSITDGDGIPDKYQALVTYKVEGGTWDGSDTDDKIEVFTLKEKNGTTGEWTDISPVPTLGDTIPDTSKAEPDATNTTPAYWSPTPHSTDKVKAGTTVYTYKFPDKGNELTFTFDANGGAWEEAVEGYEMGSGNLTATQKNLFRGDKVSKISVEPVREGYDFLGWYSKATAGEHAGELTAKWWPYEDSEEYIYASQIVYAKWEESESEPETPVFSAKLIVNCQDENGASLKYEEITLTKAEWSYTPDSSITVGSDEYIYEGITSYSPTKALSGTAKNGGTVMLLLDYTKDNWNDEDNEITGGDGIPDKYQAILKYVADSHSTVSGTTTKVITLQDAAGNYVASKTMTPGTDGVTYKIDSDYKFNGWEPNPNVEQTINGGRTYTFKVTTSYDGKVEDDSYELRYNPNGGTVNPRYESETRPWVKDYDELPVPSRPGYVFTGWYDKNGNLINDDVKVDKSQVTITAGWRESAVPGMLNGDDHFAYIQGYADGTVRPNNYITRAQVATIFFRLLDADVRDDNLTTYNDFPDVVEDYWANTAISTMTKLGVINGYKDGNFRPNAYITRAEFAAICARFDDTVKSGNSSFTDINGHWAKAEIERAATLGWIQGYSDGTFRPNNNITRAQAMTMINRVLCRLPEDEDDLLRGMNTWTDCNPGDWCYLAVQEATNSHDFQHRGVYESWTDLNRDPDWSKYEN
ncbi:MAG: S-layer homology domain-containing protein [Dysosmobacter sp.]|nr:S-layer homology domain-containing protein [Dysosmobacter sp.]